jgi:MarR family transcriptional regulator, organic hydroperoxide resistance regulator
MATTTAVPADVLEALELIVFGAIGMTSFALADASASELTLSQWRALVVVGRTDGLRVGEVAVRVGMSMPAASRLLRRLERHGYVVTARDEGDRRATLVRLTAEGSRVRKAVIDRRRALLNDAVASHARRLPKDLSGGLKVLAEAFDRYE